MASFPGAIVTFGFTPAAGKALPYDVVQKQCDEIVAIETALGVGFGGGTWTPSIASAGGGTAVYSTAYGGYIKMGRLITVSGRITLASLGTLGAGQLFVSGLPFTPGATYYGSLTFTFYSNLVTSVSMLTAFIPPSAAQAALQYIPAAGATGVAGVALANIGPALDLVFTGSYWTD